MFIPNKTQKIQKAQKSFFTKMMLFSFYFLMICYGQCGYAVIEEYLTPGVGELYKFGAKYSSMAINTMELATEIATYLKNGKLCEVYIQLSELEEQDNIRHLILKALAEALRNNTVLTTLGLEDSQIGDEGVRALAEALRNNTALTTLYLGRNKIGDEGVRALAEVLQNNTTLTALYLGLNQIGDEGARTLAEVLRNNTALTTLSLGVNQIGIEGVRAIAEALRNNTALTTLYFGRNQISDEGARALAEALRNNTALTMLDIQSNQIGVEGARALTAALTNNYTLLKFIKDNWDSDKKPLLRNNLLLKLLRKIKRASNFTFTIGCCHTYFGLGYVLPYILDLADLNVRDRTAFENIQNYNTEGIRDTVFRGNLEEVIRLFYYGNDADYGEILREVNEIRRLQREILQENQCVIPQGLVELPEELPVGAALNMTQEERGQERQDFVITTFWTS